MRLTKKALNIEVLVPEKINKVRAESGGYELQSKQSNSPSMALVNRSSSFKSNQLSLNRAYSENTQVLGMNNKKSTMNLIPLNAPAPI